MIPDSAVTAIQDGVKTDVIKVEGKEYTTREVFLAPEDRTYQPPILQLNTLTGVVDYLKSMDDPLAKENIKAIVIGSPTILFLVGALVGEKKERSVYAKVEAIQGGKFAFGLYLNQEDFVINLGACFVANDDREKIAEVASHIIAEDSVTLSDDGMSQTVSTKSGLAGVKRITVKNPVSLAPVSRTFAEVEQPISQYIFRQQKGRNGAEFALFEVQNPVWILDAKAKIKAYFAEHLPGMVVIA